MTSLRVAHGGQFEHYGPTTRDTSQLAWYGGRPVVNTSIGFLRLTTEIDGIGPNTRQYWRSDNESFEMYLIYSGLCIKLGSSVDIKPRLVPRFIFICDLDGVGATSPLSSDCELNRGA